MSQNTNELYSYCGLGVNETLRWFGIPRTATQTIKKYLLNNVKDNENKRLPRCAFSVIRDPIDRFKSAICMGNSEDVVNPQPIKFNIDTVDFNNEHFLPQTKFSFHEQESPITYLFYNQNILDDIEQFLLSNGVVIKKRNKYNRNKIRLNATVSDLGLDRALAASESALRSIYSQDYEFIKRTNFWNM